MDNLTIFVQMANATASQTDVVTQTTWMAFLPSIVSSAIGALPFLFIIYLMSNGGMGFNFKINSLMSQLRKESRSGVILMAGVIDDKAMAKFETALDKAAVKGFQDIILILDTYGGWVFAAERIANKIRHYPGRIHAYIPRYSMSAGSWLAWACHDIRMGDTSSLGPIDPQMGVLFWVNSAKAWKTVCAKKGKRADDNSIAMSVYADQYTKLIKDKLSVLPQMKGRNKFIDFITNGDIPHGFQIDKAMLIKHGFNVKTINYWQVYDIAKQNPTRFKAVL